MWTIIGGVLAKIFGMGSGFSAVGNVAGAATHLTLLPALIYLGAHYNDIKCVQVPLWLAAVVLFAVYTYLEAMRRRWAGGG